MGWLDWWAVDTYSCAWRPPVPAGESRRWTRRKYNLTALGGAVKWQNEERGYVAKRGCRGEEVELAKSERSDGARGRRARPLELPGRYQSTLRGQQPNEATIFPPCDDGSGLCSDNSFDPSISCLRPCAGCELQPCCRNCRTEPLRKSRRRGRNISIRRRQTCLQMRHDNIFCLIGRRHAVLSSQQPNATNSAPKHTRRPQHHSVQPGQVWFSQARPQWPCHQGGGHYDISALMSFRA